MFVSTVRAGPGAWRLAIAVAVVSAVTFLLAVPFVRVPLEKIPAFIPAYQSALAINDLITAVLLFGQFQRLRSWALLPLASAYLFCALIIVAHTLTFPGVFAPTGLLGAGSQSTAWLYVFWHGGFPLCVTAYALMRNRGAEEASPERASRAVALAIVATAIAVVGFTLLATAGMDLLPVIMQGSDYSLLVKKGVSPALLVLCIVALVALWRQKETSVLDLWLMVVMCVWLCDIGLSAVFGSARYDLGFYVGRLYGLLAASFVLGVLLLETNGLHARLAAAKALLAERARDLETRVRDRTAELQKTNEVLQMEASVRRQAQQELVRTRAFLDLIIENIPAMVFVKDAVDRKCVLINRAGEQLLGCGRSEILGKRAAELMPAKDAAIIDALDNEVLAAKVGPAKAIEHRISSRDRGLRLLRTRKVRVLDADGNPQYVLGFSEDITEQRRLEEQLIHAQKMDALGELTGGLAHDFNNLLAIIIGNLDVLQGTGKRPAMEEELVGDALAAALRGSDLIRRLLAFARRQPLTSTRIDTNELVAGIAKLLERTLGETVQIVLDLDPAIPPAVSDPAQLETAIANLANNARDAMPKGGRLIIATCTGHLDAEYAARHSEVEPGEYVVIEVSDTGEGMPPEVMQRIFEPFFTTKEAGKGTGLGLSMVFGFMKQSGGHINVYSEPGRGTTFRLYLRRADAGAVAAPRQAPSAAAAGGRGETVLVVEDNPELRHVVVKQLEAEGYRTIAVDTAAKAIAAFEDGSRIDLLFSDVVLPGGMDGCALARELLQRRPQLHVLLTSGFPGSRLADARQGIAHVRLLSKPYRKEELLRAVREILDGAPSGQGAHSSPAQRTRVQS